VAENWKRKMEKLEIFIPENACTEETECSCRGEHLSPVKGYKLVVTPFATKKGCWDYTQRLVYSPDGKLIAEIQRNYSSFPFAFIENHPNGNVYLVAGADYQGQTVIELNTGKRRDYLPEDAAKGCGFCCADYQFDVASQILVVDGCIWACPYEYRFYDFSDPMNGWLEIVRIGSDGEEGMIDQDEKWPTFEPDGTIKCYQTESPDEVGIPSVYRVIAAILTLRRDGHKLILVDEWVSDKEKIVRAEREEARKKHEQWVKDFRASDPLYLAHKELLKDPFWKPEENEWGGITHEGWCPDFKGKEQRWGRRILERKDENPYTINLDWAVVSGPIKLTIYKDGNTTEYKFFEHSIEGMNKAFAYAKSIAE